MAVTEIYMVYLSPLDNQLIEAYLASKQCGAEALMRATGPAFTTLSLTSLIAIEVSGHLSVYKAQNPLHVRKCPNRGFNARFFALD